MSKLNLEQVDPKIRKIFEGFDDAQDGPRFGRQPREIGTLKDEYRPRVGRDSHIAMIKAHMRDMTDEEWAEMAHEMRRGVVRLCNDAVLEALLRLWVAQDQAQGLPASPSQSGPKASVKRPMTASEVRSRQLEDVRKVHKLLSAS